MAETSKYCIEINSCQEKNEPPVIGYLIHYGLFNCHLIQSDLDSYLKQLYFIYLT